MTIGFLKDHLIVVALVFIAGGVFFIRGYFNRICTSLTTPTGISPSVDYFPELSYQCTIAKVSNWILAAFILITLVFIGIKIAQRRKTILHI